MKKNMHIVLLVLVLIVVAIFFMKNFTTEKNSSDKQELTIAMVTFPGYAPLYIAKDKGYFGSTKVNLLFIESIGELRSALKSGRIDAFAGTYDMLQSIKDEKPEGVAFLAIDESRGADGIVASKDITQPSDISGKIVGTEPGFPAYLVLQSFLRKGGLKLSDVQFKDMPSKDVPAAYLSKSLQVGATYEPYLSEILSKSKDSHVVVSTKDTPGLVVDFLWASNESLKNKSTALSNLASGYFKAVNLMQTSPDEAFGLAAKVFSVSLEEMKSFKDGLIWPDLAYNKQLLTKGNSEGSAYFMFSYIGDLLRANNETNLTLKATDYITDSIIKKIE